MTMKSPGVNDTLLELHPRALETIAAYFLTVVSNSAHCQLKLFYINYAIEVALCVCLDIEHSFDNTSQGKTQKAIIGRKVMNILAPQMDKTLETSVGTNPTAMNTNQGSIQCGII